jgi:hypothetical protein
MSKPKLALGVLMSCASAALAAAQSPTLVQHPFRHNRTVPGEIFGDPNVSNSLNARPDTEPLLAGKYLVGPEVHPTTTWWEAEEEIAIDPADPLLLIAAISDFSLSRYGFPYTNQTKYAWSSDGGFHWQQRFMPYDQSGSGNPLTADGLSWNEMSDPVVAIDSSRKIAYLSDLYFSDFDWSNGYYISSSSFKNGSVSFTAANTRPVAVSTDPNSQTFEDKPWIAVDNTRNPATSGNLYAAWVHYLAQQYFPAGGEIHVVRSSDHGATFSTATVVSPTWQVNNVQAPQIAVDPRGRVIVSWLYCLDYEPVPGQFNDKCIQSQIWGAVSTDAGATFSTPIQISPTINDLDGSGFPSIYRKWSAPAMAVDPNSGKIAVVYADQAGSTSVMEYVRCAPGFAGPCSQPVAISDVNYGQRVFPAVAIDNLGIVHASWYDSRNAASDTYSGQLDIYATYADSVTLPFHKNTRVTRSTINVNAWNVPGAPYYLGDYTGIAASWGIAHPAWADGLLATTPLVAP